MAETEAKKRVSALGLIKFLAAIAIVYYHIFPSSNDHWSQLYILVELFFIISGYFTFLHFQKDKNAIREDSLERKAKNALIYTWKKYINFLPYIIFATIFCYAPIAFQSIRNNNLYSALDTIKYAISDIFLLGGQIGESKNFAIWFLSAMIIVFPLFCIICQTKHKNAILVAILPMSLIYYLNFYNSYCCLGAGSLARAFFGLMLGLIVYITSSKIKGIQTSKKTNAKLQILETVFFIVSIILLYPSKSSQNIHYIVIFTLISFLSYLSILLSGKTSVCKISNRLFDFLEKISLIIYLIHIPTFRLILYFSPDRLTCTVFYMIVVPLLIFLSSSVYCIWEYIARDKSKVSALIDKNCYNIDK